MPPTASTPSVVTRREVGFAVLAAFVGLPLALLLLAGPTLFARPFWLDEALSWLIASDPDLGHGMAALAGGVDTNAPLLHLLFHVVGNAFGHTPPVYRLAALAGMAATLVGLYLSLRRTVRPGPATLGCVAFLSLPLVLNHATEARFYAWLLAATVWTALGLTWRRDRCDVRSVVLVAVASVALCGLHYFGVIALACLIVADVMTDGRGAAGRAWRDRVHRAFPATAGFATTLCLWPLVRTQRAAMASVGGTWVPDEFVVNLQTVVASVLPTLPLLCGIALVTAAAAAGGVGALRAAVRSNLRTPLAGVILYAVVLLAFDRLVQPVLVPRYFVVALPAVALLVAAAATRLSPGGVRIALAIALTLMAGRFVHIRARIASPTPHSAMGILAGVDAAPNGAPVGPIVSDWFGYALPVWAARPELRDRLRYLPDARIVEPSLAQSIPYDRRMAAIVNAFYGTPRHVDHADVDRLDRFVLLTEFRESLGERFGGWQCVPRTETAFEMSRRVTETAASAD